MHEAALHGPRIRTVFRTARIASDAFVLEFIE